MTDLVAGERVVDLAGWRRAAPERRSDEALPLVPEPGATPASPARGCVDDTLRGVDDVLEQAMSEVADGWHRLRPPPLNVLDHDLPQWLAQLVGGRGKRIRPAMCHWGFLAAGGTPLGRHHDALVQVAAGLELLHVFALIHDDVMDDSAMRRGIPAAHRQAERWHAAATARGDGAAFGRNIAVLLGDLALVQAHRLIAEARPAVQQQWYEMCLELVSGQRGDLTGAAAGRADRRHAERVADLKSGAYTVARPVLLGAVAAAGSDPALAALREFGRHAGTAFALRDDVLGVWGEPSTTGKPVGDDLLSGKPTVLASLAGERLTGPAGAALGRAGSPRMSADDVRTVQDGMIEAGIRDEVERLIADHVAKAEEALTSGALSAEGVAGLTAMARRLAWRAA